MNATIHVGLSVRGALRNGAWRRELVNCVTTDGGEKLDTSDKVFDFLCDQLKLGREMLPCGECDNWDWETGCRGHEKR